MLNLKPVTRMVDVMKCGRLYTKDFKLYFKKNNKLISPFHEIPMKNDENVYNMIVEIPRWTNAKMEICTKLPFNPIKQDIKKGNVRFVHNVFPHQGYMWNYGAIPQTWEDPTVKDAHTKLAGDDDPIDVCEIGGKIQKRGDVIQVKVLGVLAMLDDGETDWKVIVIDINDSIASQLNDIEDVERLMPGYLSETRNWFKFYKVPAGKPENVFAFDGKYQNKDFAEKIINETHQSWKKMMNNETDSGEISKIISENKEGEEIMENLKNSEGFSGGDGIEMIGEEYQKWYFVKKD
ncbi:hypothetical protein SNEBB_006379 [Seison nebaliae]|nr:hypothetical protein SNEBB_006379 [Seison nebaliae]